MSSLALDTQYVDKKYLGQIPEWIPKIEEAFHMLHEGTGAGGEYGRGWMALPNDYGKEEFLRIKEVAHRLRDEVDAFVVIGIGGSYLGARAAIDLLTHGYDWRPEIYFIGHHMGSDAIRELLETLEGKEVAVNVISKSGTTLEPAVAFRFLRSWMEEEYGHEKASKRIFATTDQKFGALRSLAVKEGYETFVIPSDIGGRYSVLTPVGLFPMAVAGLDIDNLMEGAREEMQMLSSFDPESVLTTYVSLRHILYSEGKSTELLSNFLPKTHYLGEWWKQLFGESEGKEGRGIYPDTLDFSTDLHSLGQYVQEGERRFFETCLYFDGARCGDLHIPSDDDNLDGLNYIADRSVRSVNEAAMYATLSAHSEGGVPALLLSTHQISERNLGGVLYFFMKACAISGYVLGVNPFNQPGVEAYKSKMFELLRKPE